MTANPGGVGQLWIKERFIDPAPLGMKTLTRELPNGQKHKYIYIPSRVQDNQILLQNDPNYINNLYLVGSKELVKAWLEGSWDAIEGAYFPEFSVDRHVIKPFKIPERWKRYIGYDWGYFSDSACVWIAISDGRDDNGNKLQYPKGSVVVYREWIESKLSNEDQAKKILELSAGEEIEIRAADPSIFASQGGPSIAQQMQDCGLTFHKADNARVAGWSQLRRRLNPGEGLTPMIYFFDACTTAIEAVAAAPVCKKNAEDLDTTFPNDHVCFSGSTLVDTANGQIPIKDLVNKQFKVNTRCGYKNAIGAKTGRKRLYKVALSNKKSFNATIDHRILTGMGWKEVGELNIGDRLIESNRNIRNNTRVRWAKILQMRSLFQQASKRCQRWCQITQESIRASFWENSSRYAYSSQGWEQVQQSNREFRNGKCKSTCGQAHDKSKKATNKRAYFSSTRQSNSLASFRGGEGLASETCKESSRQYKICKKRMLLVPKRIFYKSTKAFSILSSKLQNASKDTRVISIRPKGIDDVFCLYVPEYNEFTIEGGLVVHNCDALRYSLMENLYVQTDYHKPEEYATKGSINISNLVQKHKAKNRKSKI